MRRRLPGAVELVADTYTGLAIGWGPTERPRDAVLSLVVYPRWVNLFFLRGASLDDPERLLQGTGSRVRHIRLDAATVLDDPAVVRLVRQAAAKAVPPIDAKARRRTRVFAQTANRRARRSKA